MERSYLVPILVILFVLVAGVGFFFGRQSASVSPQTEMTLELEVTPEPTVEPEIITGQNIQDSAGLYSVQIPIDWQVTMESAQGVRISGLLAQSPDYDVEINDTVEGPNSLIYHRAGAGLQITVTNQPLDDFQPAGQIMLQRAVVVDGVGGTYYQFQEPSTAEGELLLVVFEKDGHSYHVRWSYNPEEMPDGQELFSQIVKSIRLN